MPAPSSGDWERHSFLALRGSPKWKLADICCSWQTPTVDYGLYRPVLLLCDLVGGPHQIHIARHIQCVQPLGAVIAGPAGLQSDGGWNAHECAAIGCLWQMFATQCVVSTMLHHSKDSRRSKPIGKRCCIAPLGMKGWRSACSGPSPQRAADAGLATHDGCPVAGDRHPIGTEWD